jgi:acyl-CoA thioesterase-1
MELFRTTFVAAASRRARTRSYGDRNRRVQALIAAAGFVTLCAAYLFASALPAQAQAGVQDRPVKIVVFGDSLSAGLGLPAAEAFPAKLASALKAKGLAVDIADAGVSGDTTSAGLGRLDWSVPDGTDAVIVELGANDALRGVDPKITRAALDQILRRLQERGIAVLLAGMQAPRNLGASYARGFDAIFPELAAAHGALFYPFFLDGVVADATLNQRDGIHPNAQGVDVIVARILPKVEQLVTRAREKPRS